LQQNHYYGLTHFIEVPYAKATTPKKEAPKASTSKKTKEVTVSHNNISRMSSFSKRGYNPTSITIHN
jgi:N-acetylmuramoyl-L-alanine amidase